MCQSIEPMTNVTVTKRGASRVRNGHLWIYRSDVLDAGDAEGGSLSPSEISTATLWGRLSSVMLPKSPCVC